jgi:hypothetical protein
MPLDSPIVESERKVARQYQGIHGMDSVMAQCWVESSQPHRTSTDGVAGIRLVQPLVLQLTCMVDYYCGCNQLVDYYSALSRDYLFSLDSTCQGTLSQW